MDTGSEGSSNTNKALAHVAAMQERRAASLAAGKECPCVLVVDDEEIVANTTMQILNSVGFCALVAYDGQTALEIAGKVKPAIVLTDIWMPGMNGVALAIEVRKAMPDTRIVLFSGQAGVLDMLEEAKKDGHSFELVAKPLHPAKLIERMRELAGK